MIKEATLVRLPAPLSKAIDEAVDDFVRKRETLDLKKHKRWQGADLWMVFRDETSDAETAVTVTYRVTVAAYSDDPGRLVFIPDIMKTTLAGRYIMDESHRASLVETLLTDLAANEKMLYVDEAVWHLASPEYDWPSRMRFVKDEVAFGLQGG